MTFEAPDVDYWALAPVLALTAGLLLAVLLAVAGRLSRLAPAAAIVTMLVAGGLLIGQWGEETSTIAGTLSIDGLSITFSLLILIAGIAAVLFSLGDPASSQAGRPDFIALLLGSILGMVLLTQADNLITFFVALELFSIPLYALCGTDLRREGSLESGLKYLIIGSLGSATLLFGMAFVYGASGATGFEQIAQGLSSADLISDPITLTGVGLVTVGLAFKVSLAPFHQWTPDVYQGAPTSITAFMAVATKLAGFAIFIRFFLTALEPLADDWDVILAAIAAISIVVGNLGALGQDSLKRMLGYSGIAQAGYMLGGILVATQEGVEALSFYLAAYLAMNLAAFAVLVVREQRDGSDDSISALKGLGRRDRALAWPVTIAMLGLAGLPPTVGFIGKLYLISALVDADWTWLAILVVIGSIASLGYYLRGVGVVWSGDEETPEGREGAGGGPFGALVAIGIVAAIVSIVFGVVPDPLYDFASQAAAAIGLSTG